jgi:hypothetical protein
MLLLPEYYKTILVHNQKQSNREVLLCILFIQIKSSRQKNNEYLSTVPIRQQYSAYKLQFVKMHAGAAPKTKFAGEN